MDLHALRTLPQRIADTAQLDDVMTIPSAGLIDDLARIDGDLIILGVGGKMGPTLARMAKRCCPNKRVIGVARFSDPGLRDRLQRQGVECVQCDLLDREAVDRLPRVKNVVFMAGYKFGAADNPGHMWAINAGVPYVVADVFRDSRIVAFSTACVYPFVDVRGRGANEETVDAAAIRRLRRELRCPRADVSVWLTAFRNAGAAGPAIVCDRSAVRCAA